MRFFWTLLLIAATASRIAAQDFATELRNSVQRLEKEKTAAVPGNDGWLFFTAELRLFFVGRFWGDDAVRVCRAHKPELADPLPAILDFHQQLKARGIELLVVPVPPKAVIYPEKAVLPDFAETIRTASALQGFYDELRGAGIDVLDLTSLFIKNRETGHGPVFCKTDSHWSGVGCGLTAQAIAEKVRPKLRNPPGAKEYVAEWKEVQIHGDLEGLLSPDARKPGAEKIAVQTVNEKGSGRAVEPDGNSPILLLGDSHTLVYHDFLAERAGLLDQLALELGFAPDLIGTRGSGATPVRLTLYRRSVKDAGYLAKKKVVVWCFAAREFTEATEGWARVPVAK